MSKTSWRVLVRVSSAGGRPAKRRLAALRLVAHHRRLEDAQNGDHTQLIRAHTPDARQRQPRTGSTPHLGKGSSSSMEDDFNRSMRECEDLIGRLARFGTHSPLIESTNTFREKTQERLAQLRAKFPRPPVQERRRPHSTSSTIGAARTGSRGPRNAPRSRPSSGSCVRTWRVGKTLGGQSSSSGARRWTRLRETTGNLSWPVSSRLRGRGARQRLAERAASYRLDGAESYVDACEREASGAIMGCWIVYPARMHLQHSSVGGRALRILRERLWARRLTDTKLQRGTANRGATGPCGPLRS